ncbi:MAG: GNAT family N-acetyltransferase [Acidobacteriaceae bacterium]
MGDSLLYGKQVHLTAEDPAVLAEASVNWNTDSEFLRLLDANVANQVSVKKVTEWIQRDFDKDPLPFYLFAIRTIDGERLIGWIDLEGSLFPHGEAFVGIGIGARQYWSQGYGSDAMTVILRYAFQELNLHRVALDVFEYNPRAIRCYEKAGFVHEGRVRKFLYREGRRWDMVFMGMLREEWLAGAR